MSKIVGPHQGQPLLHKGQPLDAAKTAMILIHGRGDNASNFVELAVFLPRPDMAYLAPQAAGNTWYPLSFLAPISQNEPGISSGMEMLADLVADIQAAGIPATRLVLGGFSQGACLASEFVARNAQRYGGLFVLSGGVIGPPGTPRDYKGSLAGTPVFLGCSDVDFHIPVERVHETADLFSRMDGAVTKVIYPGMAHTIIEEELAIVQQMLTELAVA